jgi:uncharacterized membrane protein
MKVATGAGAVVQAPFVRTDSFRVGIAEKTLNAAAVFWLLATLLGQWAFFIYISVFYGGSAVSGDFEVWNRLNALGRTPYIKGDTAGNFMFLAHALGAGIVALGGALQIIPQIRKHAPAFHRWNGRVFLTTVIALSVSGFYLVWVRSESPTVAGGLPITVNGLLILSFAFLALRAVRSRDLVVHRRWALRLYLVANAQWFLRVGFFSYFVVSSALGHRVQNSDVVFQLWPYGCYLVPLLVLEIFLRAKDSRSALMKSAMAGCLILLTIVMCVGIFVFSVFSQRIASGAPLQFPI